MGGIPNCRCCIKPTDCIGLLMSRREDIYHSVWIILFGSSDRTDFDHLCDCTWYNDDYGGPSLLLYIALACCIVFPAAACRFAENAISCGRSRAVILLLSLRRLLYMHLHSFAWKLNFARATVAVPGVMWTPVSAALARVWIIFI